MKQINRHNGMIWVIVVLALLNLATLGTIVFNKNRDTKEEPAGQGQIQQTGDASAMYSGRYFREQLSLNDEQMVLFREFNQSFMVRVREINSGLNRMRQEMLIEMSNNDCDTTRCNSLSDSIGYMHSELKKETFKYYLQLREICDQQQQETLKQIFGGMFSGDLPKGRNGKGGEQGRHRGRRF